jgi:hypothetical protein
MEENLLIGILGNRNSGKSTTWNTLFESTVRTGTLLRRLYLSRNEYVEVFLVSGSPEERETYVGEIITQPTARIVLCSMQYRRDVVQTLNFFHERHFYLFIHWLNPGFHDLHHEPSNDELGIVPFILRMPAMLGIRNGKLACEPRVAEIRSFIRGWAHDRNLIITE